MFYRMRMHSPRHVNETKLCSALQNIISFSVQITFQNWKIEKISFILENYPCDRIDKILLFLYISNVNRRCVSMFQTSHH